MAEAGRARPWQPRVFLTAVHRYVGLAMAVFLVITGLTGALLAFYPELDAWLNPSAFRVEPSGRVPLAVDELIARVQQARPRLDVIGVNVGEAAGDSAMVLVSPRDDTAPPVSELFADPYDGRVLAERNWGDARLDALHLLPFLYSIHMSLHMPGNIGVLLLGVVAVLWTVDCFIAFYLTLPPRSRAARKSWWQRWRTAWSIKRSAGFVRLNLDIHRAGGLWFWIPALALAVSSVAFNLGDEVFRPAVRLFGPFSPDVFESLPERPLQVAPRLSHEQAIAAARRILPAHQADDAVGYVSLLRESSAYWIAFEPHDRANRVLALDYAHVFIDADSGATLALRTFDRGTRADQFSDLQFPLHSGQILGLGGRILICICGLLITALSVTGVVIWWKKRGAQGHRSRRRDRTPSAVD